QAVEAIAWSSTEIHRRLIVAAGVVCGTRDGQLPEVERVLPASAPCRSAGAARHVAWTERALIIEPLVRCPELQDARRLGIAGPPDIAEVDAGFGGEVEAASSERTRIHEGILDLVQTRQSTRERRVRRALEHGDSR